MKKRITSFAICLTLFIVSISANLSQLNVFGLDNFVTTMKNKVLTINGIPKDDYIKDFESYAYYENINSEDMKYFIGDELTNNKIIYAKDSKEMSCMYYAVDSFYNKNGRNIEINYAFYEIYDKYTDDNNNANFIKFELLDSHGMAFKSKNNTPFVQASGSELIHHASVLIETTDKTAYKIQTGFLLANILYGIRLG